MSRKHLKITEAAKAHLLGIWLYIAEDSPENADRFIHAIEQCFQPLLDFPHLGVLREEYGVNIRLIVFQDYNIYYHPAAEDVTILHIFHGSVQAGRHFKV